MNIEINETHIKELLTKVNSIRLRESQISKLKGENFNVFRILRIENSEVKLHTRFLFELLNPKGTHDQDELFFNEFISLLNNLLPDPMKIKEFKVFQELKNEKGIGSVNYINETGGMIDIFIQTDTFAIVLENKIYATTGHKQIERYHSYLKNKPHGQVILLYLTLFKNSPVTTKLIQGKDFFQISYEDLILRWLQTCMEKSSDFPILRETIKQYIITIKRLLGKLTNIEMEEELENLLLKNYDAAKLVSETFNKVKEIKIKKMYHILFSKLKASLPQEEWDYDFSLVNLEGEWGAFEIKKKGTKKDISIYFEGDRFLKDGLKAGILLKPKPIESQINSLKKRFKGSFTTNSDNIYFNKIGNRFNSFDELLASDMDPEVMAQNVHDYIIEVINRLLKDSIDVEEILNN